MKRVLFVDDEPLVLGALKRMLWPLRSEFSTAYAGGGAEALALFEKGAFDVIVSDMRMPGMDGAELLTEVSRRWPQAVRVVLTGECGQEALARVLPVAHRFLSKPCETDLLRATIQRSCALRDVLRSPDIQAVANGMSSLPTLPEFHRRVVDELESAEPNLPRVGEIVGRDVAMTTKLIQVANSPLFGRRWPAVSPTQAVVALGSDLTRTIIMAGSLFSRLSPRAAARFRMTELWDHSRRVADLAKRVAETWDVSPRVSQDAATAGFLHEVGRLVLADRLPDRYYGVVTRATDEGITIEEAETLEFGVTHAEVGAYLLALWGLPDAVIEAIAWQHTPGRCPGFGPGAIAAVHIADALTEAIETGREPALSQEVMDELGEPEMVEEWQRQAAEVAAESCV
jgi:HD-like signal output (HDOD) protein